MRLFTLFLLSFHFCFSAQFIDSKYNSFSASKFEVSDFDSELKATGQQQIIYYTLPTTNIILGISQSSFEYDELLGIDVSNLNIGYDTTNLGLGFLYEYGDLDVIYSIYTGKISASVLSTDILDVRFKGIDAMLRSPVSDNFVLNVSLSYTHFDNLTFDTIIGLSDSQVDILEDGLEGEFELRIGVDQKLGDNLMLSYGASMVDIFDLSSLNFGIGYTF
ncbi:MAG: hypothetical protein ACJZ9L_06235 [Coraliomargaritaceae bacterium]